MSATPPAGWYPDPSDASAQRYWDGTTWTDHVAPGRPPGQPPAATEAAPTTGTAGGGTGGTETWPPSDTAGEWVASIDAPPAGGTVSTWTWQSFLVTLLCGGTIISMVGIYNAGKAEAALEAGDVGRAQLYARRARNWTLGGLVFGLLIVGVAVAALVAAGLAIGDGGLADECATVTRDDPFTFAFCEAYCDGNDVDAVCEEFDR